MKKEEKRMLQLIQTIEGNVLAIGISDPIIIEAFEKNDRIEKCYFLNTISNESGKAKGRKKRKNFSMNRLRKKFHKKKIDYIICNIEEMIPHMNTFIKDSVYINRKKLYFFGPNQLKYSKIWKRYQQYHAKIEHEKIGNSYLTTISNEHSKTNKMKDIYFLIHDCLKKMYDVIGDLLID